MQEKIIHLIYPPQLVEVPVIQQLIREFELTVNIIRADLSLDSGWIEIKLSGSEQEIEKAETWLKNSGMELQTKEEK